VDFAVTSTGVRVDVWASQDEAEIGLRGLEGTISGTAAGEGLGGGHVGTGAGGDDFLCGGLLGHLGFTQGELGVLGVSRTMRGHC
jgi:hypothetical protein